MHSTTKLALAFTLAALCKATAIATPLALLAWELIRRFTPYKSGSASFREKLALLLPVLPVAAWFWYHKAETGFIFGNPEFYRYNVSATADLLRIGLAFVQRIWHLFGHMNMIALTAAGMIAMFWPALRDAEGKRQRMAVPIQLAFAAIVLANLLAFSILGGALLTRYLLPLYPLVILVWLSTLRRRLNAWLGLSLMICGLFIVALFINPPYRFAPEDNLSYREYILLHKRAAGLIEAKHANDRVLTAWPASDELRKPFLGYVAKPVTVTTIQNFSLDQIATAAQAPDTFDTALLFSTKYEPDRPLLRFRFWDRIHEKYFDYHQDIPPELAAQMLGGQIIHKERRAGFWIAIVEIPKIRLAAR